MSGEALAALDRMHAAKLEAYRKLAEEAKAEAGASFCGFKPLKSDALAVHPDQVKEATEDARAKGVPTEYTRDGRPIFTSRAHRKAYCAAYGYFDRDAGYGDQAPGQKGRARDRRVETEAEMRAAYDY